MVSTRRSTSRRAQLSGARVLAELLPELINHVLSSLAAPDLLQAACVCRAWRRAARSERLWEALCAKLWADKSYVHSRFVENKAGTPARERYFASIRDARRTRITRKELCSHVWHFRFKRVAGAHWMERDPYHRGQPARTVRFELDGRVRWDNESFNNMTWRFVALPGERIKSLWQADQSGRALAVTHPDFLPFPTEVVQRHPSWGFVLNSPWVVYSTTPMQRDVNDSRTDPLCDRLLSRSVSRWQWAEAERYNAEMEISEVEISDGSSEDGGEDEGPSEPQPQPPHGEAAPAAAQHDIVVNHCDAGGECGADPDADAASGSGRGSGA